MRDHKRPRRNIQMNRTYAKHTYSCMQWNNTAQNTKINKTVSIWGCLDTDYHCNLIFPDIVIIMHTIKCRRVIWCILSLTQKTHFMGIKEQTIQTQNKSKMSVIWRKLALHTKNIIHVNEGINNTEYRQRTNLRPSDLIA